MLDLLFRFPGAFDTDEPAVRVTDNADVLLRGFVHCGFVNLSFDVRRHFDEVVTRRFRFTHGFARLFRGVNDEVVSLFASR